MRLLAISLLVANLTAVSSFAALAQAKGKSEAKPSPTPAEQAAPKKQVSYKQLEEFGPMIHDRRDAIEEFWGEGVPVKFPKGMEAFSDGLIYKKDGETVHVWYRMGKVAAVQVATLNDDATVMRAAQAILVHSDFVEDKFCVSKIYGAYNKYHDGDRNYAVLVKRPPMQWLIAGDAEFVRDFDTKLADALHTSKYGK